MALIRCKECGKQVSDKADKCPNCGYPILQSTKMRDNARAEDNAKEKVICRSKFHWAFFSTSIIVSIISLPPMLLELIAGFTIDIGAALECLMGILLWIAIIWLLPIIRYKKNYLLLTNKRILGEAGIIKILKVSAPVSKIQTIRIEKGLWGRILGYGTLTIHCITEVYHFKKLSNAEQMQKAIMDAVKQR